MGKSHSKKRPIAVSLAGGDDETARGRLLSAATYLFCKNGINATGIDAIINEAGTAKTTLYKLFGSKTNLVHVVLETEGKQWRDWFIDAIESGGGSAQAKLARIFPSLKDWFGQERFYGCPFINAVGEHDKDQKQLRAIAMRHKKDGRRHRGSDGNPRSRGRRHRGACGKFLVRTCKAEKAQTNGSRPGGTYGRLIRLSGTLHFHYSCQRPQPV